MTLSRSVITQLLVECSTASTKDTRKLSENHRVQVQRTRTRKVRLAVVIHAVLTVVGNIKKSTTRDTVIWLKVLPGLALRDSFKIEIV